MGFFASENEESVQLGQVVSGVKDVTGNITGTIRYGRNQKETTKRQIIEYSLVGLALICITVIIIFLKKK